MYTPLIRITLMLASISFALYFYLTKDYINMTCSLLGTGLIISGYFRNGTVYIAWQNLKKGKNKRAEELISKIKYPNYLSKGQKSYYHFTKGLLYSEKKEWENSLAELSKALEIGLRTKNDTAIALLNMAEVEFEQKNYDKTQDYIDKVRKQELKPLVQSETDLLEKKIKRA